MPADKSTIVIGAGPAGLTAAYSLVKAGVKVVVLEADPTYVGGLSRTIEYNGFRFDIGGHRFFSKSQEIEDLWSEILGPEFLETKRQSRIYFKHTFFAYPLDIRDVIRKLGLIESVRCLASFLRARIKPIRNPISFQDWVTNNFGARLFRTFFKTYTEKVWGMDCRDISAQWAAQRIKGLSFWTAVRSSLLPGRLGGGRTIKTLVESFRYPRLGPGMMWDACRDKIRAGGGLVLMGHTVTAARFTGGHWDVSATLTNGECRTFTASHVISSAALKEIIPSLTPPPPSHVIDAARALRYRDFITVALILRERLHLPDTWIYIHDPSVQVGRIQIFKSWSPALVPDPAYACYGMEYFCFEDDDLWSAADETILRQATDELMQIGLAGPGDVIDGCVVRQRKAYPVYDAAYERHIETIRAAVAEDYKGFHMIGRNGMHKYDNQDHAMMTALLTVRNILAGQPLYDVWRVNQDAEYQEEFSGSSGERFVPRSIA